MKLNIKYSTIFNFIIVQTILSICFYIDDNYINRWEAVSIVLLAIPITYFAEWLKKVNSVQDDQDNQ